MGTAPFAVPSLKKIVSSNNHLVGVYTSPAKKANRGMKLSISPVAEFAETENIEISSPPSISSSEELKKTTRNEFGYDNCCCLWTDIT